LDVLVGIDGSPEAEAALAWVLALHRSSLRRLTYGVVVPLGTVPEALAAGSPVRAALDRALTQADGCDPSTVILEGAPGRGSHPVRRTGGLRPPGRGYPGRSRTGGQPGHGTGHLHPRACSPGERPAGPAVAEPASS
jgi:hypothetical protein